jgi:pyruvate-ferredoxin/flavodoxin oxidoreductase
VTACGEHEALRMVQETEEVNAEHESGTAFLDLLPDTSQKYLGLYNDSRPQDSKTATLRNMLMVRRNYDALVSGDGACAGCGEKSILRANRGGDRGVHASALPREGRPPPREGRPAG